MNIDDIDIELPSESEETQKKTSNNILNTLDL